jgi:undecaprenyl-diphosphatase
MEHLHAWHAALLVLVAVSAVWVRQVLMPRRPADAGISRPRRIPEGDPRPTSDGIGLRIVVNPSSGPALRRSPLERLQEALPSADIHELTEDDDLGALLRDPAFGSIGAAGGDGTLAAAASAAVERDATFVAVPAGTLNHLARDLGLDDADDAIGAVRAGYAICMDVGVVDDRVFVNTLSFGGYAPVVDRREQLEHYIGKWPALLVALVWELPRMRPLQLEVDDRRMKVWLAFVGNCAYSPPGLAPRWRERLDDGLLDIRLVHGGRPFSRTRFMLAALAGRVRRSHVYSEWRAEKLTVKCLDGAQRIAADGETFDAPAEFTVSKRPRALRVAVPAPD